MAAAAARDEAGRKSAAKSDGAEERKPSTKCRKGKKAKCKLAVRSNGAGKPKTHGLAAMSIAEKKSKEEVFEWAMMKIAEAKLNEAAHESAVMRISEELPREEALALFTYQNNFWMKNRNAVYDKASGEAVSSIQQCLIASISRHNDLFPLFRGWIGNLFLVEKIQVLKAAADNWKSFNDSDKAPYVAKARANQILLAEFQEFKKTRKLTHAMMSLKM